MRQFRLARSLRHAASSDLFQEKSNGYPTEKRWHGARIVNAGWFLMGVTGASTV
jgi:hypothetical protein